MNNRTNPLSQTVLYSVMVIFSVFFFVYLIFWEPIKKYFITEFWKSMSEKEYLGELLTDLSNDPNSLFGKKK